MYPLSKGATTMITVGVKELKQQASKLIRMVRTQGSEVQVTYHGHVVALITPVNVTPEDDEPGWVELDHLAAQIGSKWAGGASAVEAVQEGRR
jgi:antitoxin (DNA-binding transcriptional repressor) of toxin-antitoxin stability system